MQFIDLRTQQQQIRERLEQRIASVLDHGQYILGPEVGELEQKLAEFVGVRHCIGVANGTDALLVALMALDTGPGDEVIIPAFNFFATAEMTALLGAKPVFVDIDPANYNLDPNKLEPLINARTKAIVPVSMFGQCANYEAINAIATQHNVCVIEDAAQSFGATRNGRRSGGLTPIATTSFFPSKPLGGYGDGGALFCDDDALAKRLRLLSQHGQERRYHHVQVGINGRLDTLQAAILLEKFLIFPGEIELRQQVAQGYADALNAAGINPPVIDSGNLSVYAQYTLQVDNRSSVQRELADRGVPTAVHYPVPVNRQPAVADASADVPASELASERVMSLPMHPYLEHSTQREIVAALGAALGAATPQGNTA